MACLGLAHPFCLKEDKWKLRLPPWVINYGVTFLQCIGLIVALCAFHVFEASAQAEGLLPLLTKTNLHGFFLHCDPLILPNCWMSRRFERAALKKKNADLCAKCNYLHLWEIVPHWRKSRKGNTIIAMEQGEGFAWSTIKEVGSFLRWSSHSKNLLLLSFAWEVSVAADVLL